MSNAHTPTHATMGESLDIDSVEGILKTRINEEVQSCTHAQQVIFTTVYNDEHPLSVDAAAKHLGMNRNTVRVTLAYAEARIWRSVAASLARDLLATIPEPTTTTMRAEVMFSMQDNGASIRPRGHTNNDDRLQLGTGSEHVMRVTEGGTGNRRMSQPHEHIIRTHTENIGRGEYTPEQMVARYCK